MRALIAGGLVVAVSAAGAQNSPTFEVASVRPNNGADRSYKTTWFVDGRFRSTNTTVRNLIELAYNLRSDNHPLNAPAWIASERFDIDAIPAVPATLRQERELMLQGLLRERFALIMRERPVDIPVESAPSLGI